jgi:hypothetical protein
LSLLQRQLPQEQASERVLVPLLLLLQALLLLQLLLLLQVWV